MDDFQTRLQSALQALGQDRHQDAETACRESAARAPGDARPLFLLGKITRAAGRVSESVTWLQRAAELEPRSVKILQELAASHSEQGDHAQALACLLRATELNPRRAESFHRLGNEHHALGEPEQAAQAFARAVQLDPGDYRSWNNLGKMLQELNQIEAAIAAFSRAVALEPDSAMIHCNRAVTLLAAGRLPEGFQEFEWRWRLFQPRPPTPPVWEGQPIPAETLLVHCEQGLGDTLQFIRFLPQARARAGRVILECQPPLKTLLEASACADEVVAVGEPLPRHDRRIGLLSLPRVFATTLQTLPAPIPYLIPPRDTALIEPGTSRRKVGLAWGANPSSPAHATRSVPAAELAPILDVEGVLFYCLQVPLPAHEEPWVRSRSNLIDLNPRLTDFNQTAAAIAGLDLVISADTAVAHVAGALGKPVWTLLPYAGDWRWFMNREDSPWYATMRLFRQTSPGLWGPVIARVTTELRRIAAATAS